MAILQTNKQKVAVFLVSVYALTIYTLWNTFRQSHSFLQWSIKLNQGFSFIIVCGFLLVNFLLMWQGATSALFGELRIIEQEHVFERLPLIVISIVMITSSFSSDQIFNVLIFSTGFLVMQVFTWILKDRLEGLLQTINGDTTLTKLVFSNFIRNMIIFAILNYFTTKYTFFNNLKPFYHNLNNTNISLLIFGYNFTSILIQYLNILCHTILNLYAFYYTQSPHLHHNQNGDDNMEVDEEEEEEEEKDFEGKFIYEKCINFTTKLMDVILDFTLLIPFRFKTFYIKDLIWDLILLIKMGIDLFKIWQNNKKLDDKLPDIIAEDLIGHDNICIVCMDDLVELSHRKKHEIDVGDEEITYTQDDIKTMSKRKRPKILPCGHMLHFGCLKHWMERSQTCPTCRLNVFDNDGNVKPVKHHNVSASTVIPQTTQQSEHNSTGPTPTPTQDSRLPTSGSDSNSSEASNIIPSSNTNSADNIERTPNDQTRNTTPSSRYQSSPLENKPSRLGKWSSFQLQHQSPDGSRVKFQVKDADSRTKDVELVVTSNENFNEPYITLNRSYFEGIEDINT